MFKRKRESDKEHLDASNDSDNETGEEVEVEFGFFDLKDTDFHGVRLLCDHNLEDEAVDHFGELADMICDQPEVGCAIKVTDGEEVLGFLTALPIEKFADKPTMKKLVAYIKGKAPSKVVELDSILRQPGTAIILSERLTNVPNDLAPHLYESLLQDVEWAKQEKIDYFDNIRTYVLLSRVCTLREAETKQSKKKKNKPAPAGEMFPIKMEEEAILQASSFGYHFQLSPADKHASLQDSLAQFGAVSVISAEKLRALVQQGLPLSG